MTYESPITLIKTQTDNFIKEINNKTDEVIFKAVVNVLPEVNKEELIKALSYDRGQYSKGYKDRDDEIVRCKDCRHQEFYINDTESFHCRKSGVVNMHMDDGDGDFFCKYGERREP